MDMLKQMHVGRRFRRRHGHWTDAQGGLQGMGGGTMSYVHKVVIGDATLFHGDCIEVMRGMADSCVDSIVCDPPYLLGFMGKAWDAADGIAGKPDVWREALRVLKPGGHLLAFGAPRTNHRMVTAIEDAGFEIRDSIQWIFGSGFPKSMDVSKAIDKAAGVRGHDAHGFNAAGIGESNGGSKFRSDHPDYVKPQGITEAAQQWQGWGTALKPAFEPICVARKPLIGTVAANVLHWGTGALNIDACRVAGESTVRIQGEAQIGFHSGNFAPGLATGSAAGRWPANLIHDGSPEVLAGFPDSKSGGYPCEGGRRSQVATYGKPTARGEQKFTSSEGSAARFFYTAKASKSDRHEGLTIPGPQFTHGTTLRKVENTETKGNHHPTVKPTDLMAYLCRLVTPPGGTVLDIFMGSGSTGKAAAIEGFEFIGIEQNAEYFEISQARIQQAHAQGQLFAPERAKQEQVVLV